MLKKTTLLKILLIPVLTFFIVSSVWCGMRMHGLYEQKRDLKKDFNEINSLQNGILSADLWRDQIKTILDNRINDFTINATQEKVLESEVSKILYALINTTDSIIENNHNTLTQKLRRAAIRTFVKKDDVRKKVPELTQSIMKEIKKPVNMEKIKQLARDKVSEYAMLTLSNPDYKNKLNSALEKYNVKSIAEFNKKAATRIYDIVLLTYRFSIFVIGTVILFLLLWWIFFNKPELHPLLFIYSTILSFIVLVIGITSPMIEIDARISDLSFLLMGDTINFTEQVIFFQSKSIVDVVSVLIKTGKIDTVSVGILLLVFSIVFPVSKLIASGIHITNPTKFKKNKIIDFLAFRSGKWSMADVMVVAIFMAFIGFKSILDSEMRKGLNAVTENYSIISTNLTALQPGFLVFVSFVIFSLTLSSILKKLQRQNDANINPSVIH